MKTIKEFLRNNWPLYRARVEKAYLDRALDHADLKRRQDDIARR